MWIVASLLLSLSAQGAVAPPPAADRGVAEELRAVERLMASRLPMTQSSDTGPVTFTAMEARGTEFITTMEVEVDLDSAAGEARMQHFVAREVCNNRPLRALVERGATFTYILVDSEGESFRGSASSCNAARRAPRRSQT